MITRILITAGIILSTAGASLAQTQFVFRYKSDNLVRTSVSTPEPPLPEIENGGLKFGALQDFTYLSRDESNQIKINDKFFGAIEVINSTNSDLTASLQISGLPTPFKPLFQPMYKAQNCTIPANSTVICMQAVTITQAEIDNFKDNDCSSSMNPADGQIVTNVFYYADAEFDNKFSTSSVSYQYPFCS